MSSDTFSISLLSIDGDTAELLCATSTAGGLNDYAVTRSFALMALEDGMGYGASTPLQQGVAAGGGQVWDEKFHREHVGKFIAKTELVKRIGIILDEKAWQKGRFADDAGADVEENYPLHKFVLRVQVTDPKYLEGLTVGERWGTTAFDAWWDDPLRPSRDAMAAVENAATYWTSAPRKPKAKKAAKKTATKKTAAKKTAAKKTPARTTAAKKAPAKKSTKKTPAEKTPARKATKKTPARKATKKTAAEKAPAKRSTKKTAAKRAPARTTAKKKPAKKTAKR